MTWNDATASEVAGKLDVQPANRTARPGNGCGDSKGPGSDNDCLARLFGWHEAGSPDINCQPTLSLTVAMNLLAELEALLNAFRSAKIDYALCGGFALAAYGIVRATEDIDLLVQEDKLPRISEMFARLGFLREKSPLVFQAGRLTMHRFVKGQTGSEKFVLVDLLVVGELTAEAWRSRRSVMSASGDFIVVSSQGMIDLKRLRNSGQDQDDIRRLEELPDES